MLQNQRSWFLRTIERPFRTAIGLIKPITRKGDLKKKLLSLAPRWILNFVFKRVYISNPNEGSKHGLILPWNQNRAAKTTIISFDLNLKHVEVEKYAFQEFTREMVHNEKDYLNKLKGDSEAKIIVPEVKDFRETKDYTLLVQDFYFGEYVEEINTNILSFFDKLNSKTIYALHEHPYLKSKWPTISSSLTQWNCEDLLDSLDSGLEKFKDVKFQVATMHSDFSTTNTVHTADDKYVIIDWEDAEKEGINIDVPFFKFRRHLYEHGNWSITNAESFLVVFHYIWFMVSKNNRQMLESFRFDGKEFSV